MKPRRNRRRAFSLPAAAIAESLEGRRLLSAVPVPVGSETRVNTFTTSSQNFPVVASDPAGDSVVTWQSQDQDGSQYGVYAQRYNSSGVAQGAEFRVNTYTYLMQTSPKIAMDNSGDFVITWVSNGQTGAGADIYAQRYSAAGVPEGTEFLVNSYTTGDQTRQSIAMDNAGDFVIAWDSSVEDSGGYGVYAQRYNSSGAAQGGEFRVNTYTVGKQFSPTTAMDANGDFLIDWQSAGQDQGGEGIYAQLYTSTGSVQGSEFRVNTYTTSDQTNSSIAMDSNGNFVIAWDSYLQDGGYGGIFAQRYNATGVPQGSEFQVNTYTQNNQFDPAIVHDSAGDFVIGWVSNGQDGSDYGLYAQRYSSTGAALGLNFQVNTFTTSGQDEFSIAMDAAGSWVEAWRSHSEDGSGDGIFAKAFTPSGAASDEFQVNTYTTGDQAYPAIAIDSQGEFTVTWASLYQDKSEWGVYAQRYDLAAAANQAPLGTSNTVTTQLNTAYVFKTSDFGFSDPNDSPPNSLLAVKITLLPTAQTLTDNGVPVSLNQSVSAADISNGKLVAQPETNLSGGPYFVFKFQVQDDGGIANGGSDLDPVAKVMDFNITPVNHAPSGTSATVTTGENVAYVFKTSDFGFSDPNDSPANSLLAVKFTLLSASQTLTDNGVPVSVNQFVTATDISQGKLVVKPSTNLLGGPYFVFKFQVEDDGGTANGGVNLDPVAKVMDLTVTNVNHAPTGKSATVTTSKNTAYVFQTTDFGFSDPNDSPANTLLAVKITLLPTAQTLTDNGVPVTLNQFVSASDISNGKFVVKPMTNLTGGPYFVFKFQVEDNGGTANGGSNLDPDAKIMDFTINP